MDKYQAMDDKCGSVLARIAASMSFFTPEIMEADEHQILVYIQEEPGLAQYEFLLKSMLREKEHVLSAPEENILAQMSEVTGATSDVFKMLNNADLTFGTVTDEDGDEVKFVFVPTDLDEGTYNVEIGERVHSRMYQIKGTNLYMEFRYSPFLSTFDEGVLEWPFYGNGTFFERE